MTRPARSVRVFLSSTFGDMQEERCELVDRVFPRLRRELEPLGIDLVEIDLRWGVPRDNPFSLLACLNEVDACHPFFLGFLGHQCGSLITPKAIPQRADLPPALREAFERLQQFVGRSYTEVEIWRALPDRSALQAEAMFFFRSQALSDAVLSQAGDLVANARAAAPAHPAATWMVRQLGAVLERAQDPEQLRQAEELRRSIEEKVGPVPEYTSAQELGRWVEEGLRARIRKLLDRDESLPGWRTPAPAWLALRSRRFYGEAAHFGRLNRALHRSGIVVLSGPEGGGRTALLAAWARLAAGCAWPDGAKVAVRGWWPWSAAWTARACARAGDRFATRLWVSAEATDAHTDWREVLRWLVAELARVAGVPAEPHLAGDAELSFRLFPDMLARAARRGPVLVILDGVDHLLNAPASDPLAWLPATVPAGVTLLVSWRAAPRRRLLTAARGWRSLELPALSPRQRRRLTESLLRSYGKELRACGGEAPLRQSAARTPRDLCVLADWLRRAGYAAEAQARAEAAAQAPTAPALMAHLLQRNATELQDAGSLQGVDAAAVFAEALWLLVLARAGLGETALRALLGPGGERLLAVVWVALLDRLKGFLRERDGRYLPQAGLQEAIQLAWPAAEAETTRRRRQLGEYFASRLPAPEALREAPWQWYWLGDGDALRHFFEHPEWLAAWLRERPYEAEIVWAAWSTDNLAEVVRPTLDRLARNALAPERSLEEAVTLASFAFRRAPGERRLAVWQALGQRAQISGAAPLLQWRCLEEQAAALTSLQRWHEAEVAWRSLARAQQEAGAHGAQCASLFELAGLLETRGRLAEALATTQEARRASELAGDLWTRQRAASAFGRLLTRLPEQAAWRTALPLFREAERCARLLGDLPGLVVALGLQGDLWRRLGNLREANAAHTREAALAARLGEAGLEQAALGGLAAVALARARFDEMETLLARRRALAREAGLALAEMQTLMQYVLSYERWIESARYPERRAKLRDMAHGYCGDLLQIARQSGLEDSEAARWARDRLRSPDA